MIFNSTETNRHFESVISFSFKTKKEKIKHFAVSDSLSDCLAASYLIAETIWDKINTMATEWVYKMPLFKKKCYSIQIHLKQTVLASAIWMQALKHKNEWSMASFPHFLNKKVVFYSL